MRLPFSHEAFLDVFGTYNSRLWPAALLLWIATTVVVWRWLRGGGVSARLLFSLLALHWAWSGVAYHWFFFRAINPAATLFAAAFVAQAVLLGWIAFGSRAHVAVPAGVRGLAGVALIFYGLAYPFLGLLIGLELPRLPLFAVPCPTTLVTAGFLLVTVGAPRTVVVVPVLWAAIGSSAALALDMTLDLALLVAAGLLVTDALAPHALGRRPAGQDR